MRDVVVYGAGGLGCEVAEAILAAAEDGARVRLLGFLDDGEELQGSEVLGYPVLGTGDWIRQHAGIGLVAGIGHPRVRSQVMRKGIELGGKWVTLVHPDARMSPSATVGEGAVILAGSVISARAVVSAFAHVYYLSTVSHDAVIGECACVMPRVALSGNVSVGQGAFIGVGAVTRQGVSIGDWSIVGAGAVVVKDIPSLCVAIGVPAAPVRHYGTADQMPSF